MSRLKGKTAVITGGGTGIGLGAAQRFVDEGAFVYLFGRRQEPLDAAVARLGNSVRAVRGSVTDMADLDRLYGTVKTERGGLDILFANAGTGAFAPLGAITPEQYDQIFDVNVKGLIFSVQKGLPLMKAGLIKGAAHITGGGLVENVPRVLPENTQAVLHRDAWQLPQLFQWLQKNGGVEDAEMHRVFNCGVGMVVILSASDAKAAKAQLESTGETVYQLGEIVERPAGAHQTIVV